VPETASTLIEFPTPRGAKATSLPDWRVELNEKVRAIKARRSMEALVGEAAMQKQAALPPPPAPEPKIEEPVVDEPSNPIVAAALNRVKSARENAARATVGVATAAASVALPMPVVSKPEPRIIPLPTPVPALREAEPQPALLDEPVRLVDRSPTLFDPAELLDDLDDLDFVDEPLNNEPALLAFAEAQRTRTPAPIFPRALGGIIDLAVLCLVSIPFVGTVYAIDGSFSRPTVVVLLSSTVVLLAGFYLFAMHAVGGRTVGMMLSRTRVVSEDGSLPTPKASLVRVVGYLVGLLTAGLGFAWAVFHPEGRGWHDLLSGTRVVEDHEDPYTTLS
jgi:uncharacterized RDD family membrane protein YckC